ncbi:hypothetical protein B9T16_28200 [Arthrospira sp. PCC 8006]
MRSRSVCVARIALPLTQVGVENGVASIPSHSKPCLRVSQHTAPDVDAHCHCHRVTTPCFVLLCSELYAARSLSTRSRRNTPTYYRIYIYTVARLLILIIT